MWHESPVNRGREGQTLHQLERIDVHLMTVRYMTHVYDTHTSDVMYDSCMDTLVSASAGLSILSAQLYRLFSFHYWRSSDGKWKGEDRKAHQVCFILPSNAQHSYRDQTQLTSLQVRTDKRALAGSICSRPNPVPFKLPHLPTQYRSLPNSHLFDILLCARTIQ